MGKLHNFESFLKESAKFSNEIKSEEYWKSVLKGDKYALKVLDTVMKKQKGFASDRQLDIMKRVASGNKSYSTKN
jgi:hypothetical protein